MNKNEIITKLINVANNRQKIIERLAADVDLKAEIARLNAENAELAGTTEEEQLSPLEMMLKEMPKIKKRIETLDSQISPVVRILNQKGLPLEVLQQAQKEYKAYRWKKSALNDRLLELKQRVEDLQRAPEVKNDPSLEEAPVKREKTQLDLLLQKIEMIERSIKQTEKDMAPLVAILSTKKLSPNIAEATKERHDRLATKLSQLKAELAIEKKRAENLAKPESVAPVAPADKLEVKKIPVEFIMADTGEIKKTHLIDSQMQNVKRDLGRVPHKISFKKKPDGSEFIEITLKDNTDDINFPAFLKHLITTAANKNADINKQGTTMDQKKLIARLVKVANLQQKIINKLAQQNTDIVSLQGGKSPGVTTPPPAQHIPTAGGAHVTPANAVAAELAKPENATLLRCLVQQPDKSFVKTTGDEVTFTFKKGLSRNPKVTGLTAKVMQSATQVVGRPLTPIFTE